MEYKGELYAKIANTYLEISHTNDFKTLELSISVLKDALFVRNKMIESLDKEIDELKQGLHGIYNLCDNDNPSHELIWRIANEVLH